MSAQKKEDITPIDEKKMDLFPINEDAKAAEEALKHLAKLKKQKLAWDPNMPDEIEDELDEAFDTDDYKEHMHIAEELMANSPYPEVRAAVLNYDSGGHSNTIRAWHTEQFPKNPGIVIAKFDCKFVN